MGGRSSGDYTGELKVSVGGKGNRKVEVWKQTTDGHKEGSTCVDIAMWTGEVGGRR